MSNNLYDLIKELTPGEKKRVSHRLINPAGKSPGQSHFQSVFQIIKEKKVTSDTQLNMHLGSLNIRNLTATKYQLYHRILDIVSQDLRLFEARYYRHAIKIEYLNNKGLFKAALKMIRSLKIEVAMHERFLFKTDLYFKEIKAHIGLKDYDECLRCFEEYQVNEATDSEDAKTFLQSYNDYHRINLHYLRKGAARSTKDSLYYESFIRSRDEEIASSTLWNSTNFFNLQGLSVAHFAIGNIPKSYDLRSRIIEIFENTKHERDSDLNQYVEVLYRYVAILIFEKKYSEFDRYMQSFKSLKPRNMEEEIRIKERYYNLLLLKSLMSKNFEEAVPVIKDFEKEYKRKSFKLSHSLKPVLLGLCASISMNLKDYRKALYWNNQILNSPDYSQYREDLIFSADLFELIIHFELGNFRLLGYRLESFQRKLRSKQKLYRLEEILVRGIHRLLDADNDKHRSSIFHELGSEIEKYKDDPFEKDLLNKFDLIAYFKSKSNNTA